MATFEVFTKRGAPTVNAPLVSIQRRGTLSLNLAAFEALGQPAAVEFLFDRTERVMGLRRVDPSVRHAYPVRKQQVSSTYVLAGAAFLNHYGVEADVRRRYPAQMDGDVLAVDLKQEALETGKRRKMQDRADAELQKTPDGGGKQTVATRGVVDTDATVRRRRLRAQKTASPR
jgi:hypothetical protein